MTLRNGSMPARAIEHLQSLPEGSRLSSEDLAAAVGYSGSSFAQCMAAARRQGAIVGEREGKGTAWFLPVAKAEAEPADFNAAVWADGDLVIYGAQENEDGSITLNRDQVSTIKRLITWMPA